MTTQMKNKTLSLLGVGILALVFLVGVASAAVTFNPTTLSATVEQGDSVTLSFTVTENDTEDFTNILFDDPVTLTLGTTNTFDTSAISNPISSLSKGQTSPSMSLSVSVPETQQVGLYMGTLVLTATEGNADLLIKITVVEPLTKRICAYDDGVTANDAELKVNIRDISVLSGFGDDNEWLPLDEVEVEIRVENDGKYDVDDISLEWGIVGDDLDDDWVVEFDEIDEFNLKDGDEDSFTITFRIDEDDLDMDLEDIVGNDYNLVVRATGTIDDSDADALDGAKNCAADFESVSVQDERDFVIVDNIQMEEALDTVACGTIVHLTADVWNIGDDQDDVYVVIYNKELGVNEEVEVGDIDAFDKEEISFGFQIPEGMKEQWYTLKFTVYDEDNDVYQNDYDDEDSVTDFSLKVQGNCALPQATMTASLESGGKAGKSMVVRATITNPGKELTIYSISAKGYETWASAVSVEPNTLILENQQTGEVLLTIGVNANVAGDKLFNVEVYSEGELVLSQPVSVSVQKAFIPIGNELLTGLIIAISVVLLVIIIVLAVRAGRKK